MSLFRPARNTVLLFLGLITCMAIWFGVTAGSTLGIGFVLKLAAMLAAAAAFSFSQFRDSFLALGVVVGALPGAALAFGGGSFAAAHAPLGTRVGLVYALGFVVAILAAERFILRVVESENPEPAAITLLRDDWVFLLAILIVSAAAPAVVVIALPGSPVFDTIFLAGANALAVLSAWLAVPVLGSFMLAGENFIARTNRIRESWTRRLDPVAQAARLPWAWSATGIFMILLVLALFGSASIPLAHGTRGLLGPAMGSAAGMVFLGAALAARDVRRALAVFAVTAGSLCIADWGLARGGAQLDGTVMRFGAELLAICFVPIAATAAAAARSGREDAVSASEAGVQAAGPSAAIGMLAALILLAPWYREVGSARAILALVFAAFGALIFQPALAGVLEALIPRRKTLLERYRIK